MTRRTISSPFTLFFKVGMPLAVLVAFGLSLSWLFPGGGPVDHVDSAVWLAAFGFVYWICGPLKHVVIDDDCLYVSNYVREMRVLFSDVAEISESHWLHPRQVRIVFRVGTPFGRRIAFMPGTWRWFNPWSPHPIVAELEGLVAKSREAENHRVEDELPRGPAAPEKSR